MDDSKVISDKYDQDFGDSNNKNEGAEMETLLKTSIREVSAETTLEKITPFLEDFGITSCKDITLPGLSTCPVFQITRQDMRSDFFNAGKGFSVVESKVSGLMEAIEVHCFERAEKDQVEDLGTLSIPFQHDMLISTNYLLLEESKSAKRVKDTEPRYVVSGLDLHKNSKVWIPAEEAFLEVNGAKYHKASPNGIASGNSFEEATCHAICEMLERHALDKFYRSGGVRLLERVKPPSDDDRITRCLNQLNDKGISVDFILLSNEAGVSVFICFLVLPEEQNEVGAVQGFGAHLHPKIAMSRALAEAIQILALSPHRVESTDKNENSVNTISMTSKQAAIMTPQAVHQGRLSGYDMLKKIRMDTHCVEYEYMCIFNDENNWDCDRDPNLLSSQSILDTLKKGLTEMGILRLFSCIISPKSIPVTVVKVFCPGLSCIEGL